MWGKNKIDLNRTLTSVFRSVGSVIPVAKRKAAALDAKAMHDWIEQLGTEPMAGLNGTALVHLETCLVEAGYDLTDDRAYIEVLGMKDGREGYLAFKQTALENGKIGDENNQRVLESIRNDIRKRL